MILSKLDEFCDATEVAATAGTALVGNVIDLGSAPTLKDIGLGQDLFCVIQTDTEIITGGSAGTIQFKLASDAQAAIATDGTATEHFATAALVTDDSALNDARLNAGGTIAAFKLPLGNYERYLGILVVTATTTTTAGKINAFLTNDMSKWVALPNPVGA